MISSGIKRGLAASAVSALAVAGLPLLATSASATPLDTTTSSDSIYFVAPDNGAISAKNDGQNTTVSLSVVGGSNVTSVSFQYSTDGGTTYTQIPGATVARDADGNFKYDWASPVAGTNSIRATPNTGLGNAETETVVLNNALNTVELSTEGALGVFQSPYTAADTDGAGTADSAGEPEGDYVAIHGTSSTSGQAITVQDYSHTGNSVVVNSTTPTGGTTGVFKGILDIDGYTYSGGAEANQLALNASDNATHTDDGEASSLYVQQIASITATPSTQQQANPSNSVITVKVVDQQGKPVANAQIGVFDDNGTATTADDTSTILGYTDADGEYVDSSQTTADTFTYYVNTTDNDKYETGTDKSTTATVTSYTPAFSTIAISNDRSRTSFDLEELADLDNPNLVAPASPTAAHESDDFTITFKDQSGNAYQDPNVDAEYRYVIDPTDPNLPTFTTAWNQAEDNGDGTYTPGGIYDGIYDGDQPPAGDYTLEARRPNFNGTGLTTAAPVTVHADESDATWDDGTDATAPINGSYTASGKLELVDGSAGLAGRQVHVQYSPNADSTLAPQSEQPAGVTVTDPYNADVVTGAGGTFAVKLTDPTVPANVTPTPEDGTLYVYSAQESKTDGTVLADTVGQDDANQDGNPDYFYNETDDFDSTDVHFMAQPTVDSIEIDADELFGQAAPGQPVDLDVTVRGTDNTPNNPNDNPELTDYPVTISVDKGFLSPNAENVSDLKLASGHDSTGDIYGYFQNDGTSKTVSTGDNGSTAGAVAAIQRDSGFDDDGLVDLTVTVTAGGKTATKTITYDDRVLQNLGEASLDRTGDSPQGDALVGENVKFNFYTHDVFGNLAGDQDARMTDDSTLADFNTEEANDTVVSDFTNSGTSATAFAEAPTVQTLTASFNPGEVLVDANDDPDFNNKSAAVKSDPINWVNPATPPKTSPELTLKGYDSPNGEADILFANARTAAAGATVNLFKKVDGVFKKIATGTLNRHGNFHFRVKDTNGNKFTKYKAVAEPTAKTTKGNGSKRLR